MSGVLTMQHIVLGAVQSWNAVAVLCCVDAQGHVRRSERGRKQVAYDAHERRREWGVAGPSTEPRLAVGERRRAARGEIGAREWTGHRLFARTGFRGQILVNPSANVSAGLGRIEIKERPVLAMACIAACRHVGGMDRGGVASCPMGRPATERASKVAASSAKSAER